MKFVPKIRTTLEYILHYFGASVKGNFRKKRGFHGYIKIIITLPKTRFKNIYKMSTSNLKNSIDFDEKMCYYIFKEREHPKTSREVGTGWELSKSSKGGTVQWQGKLFSRR